MATDPVRAAGRLEDCAVDLTPDLVAVVCRHSRAVIDAELRRLARRVPSLTRADLEAVDTVLDELAESAILAPLRSAPGHTAPLLSRVFGAEDMSRAPARR